MGKEGRVRRQRKRVGEIKKKGGKRVFSMKREINGGFNFSLACWTARGDGGHEDADRLDRAGMHVHESRQDSTEAFASM